LDKALANNPGNIKALLLKGDILAEMDRRPEAISAYSQVMKCDPKNAEACKQRGDCLAQMGQFKEAIADLNRAAKLAPKDPWVYNKRGMAWFCQGKYQKAVADFSTAIRLQPDLALRISSVPAPPERTRLGHRRLPRGVGRKFSLSELENGVKPIK
jgi:tetratricopeptide (TPR) repeat protein